MTKYEVANREAKAAKLAAVLATDPRVAAHADLELAGADFRNEVARIAGTRTPSAQTWVRAVELARIALRNQGQAALRWIDNERAVA